MVILDRNFLIAGGLWIALVSCGTKDISKSLETSHANRLISADTEKVWTLVSRTENGEDVYGPCVENNTLTFVKASQDSLYAMGRPATCGTPDLADTLYKAKYVLSGDNDDVFLNTISLSDERYLSIGVMEVNQLTSSILHISYTAEGVVIEEQYSN